MGIEAIVGAQNVSYNPDGSYVFTNPGAMVRWIASVALVGVLVSAVGGLLVFKNRRSV